MCVVCRHARGNIVPLPITGERIALCDRCRGRRFLAHMHALVVPHG
jgi:hypothetical protein